MDDSRLLLQRRTYTDPVVVGLVEQIQQEFVERYGGPDETVLEPTGFDDPHGAFFVGFLHGRPVAMGGWRWRPDVVALGGSHAVEVKRMYVVPAAQRRGHARTVLAHLEATARGAGADVVVLETGLRQPEALSLYASAGFEPVQAFGHYSDSPIARYLGKRLDQAGTGYDGTMTTTPQEPVPADDPDLDTDLDTQADEKDIEPSMPGVDPDHPQTTADQG